MRRLALRFLKAKGVYVLRGPRRGPHSKYWYYLHHVWDRKDPFILIDDDVIYAADIPEILKAGLQSAPFNVCVRALDCSGDENRLRPYKEWPIWRDCRTSRRIFATNVGGVGIHPAFALKLLYMDEAYREHCPSADDVWFHWLSLKFDMPYTQVVEGFCNPTPLPFSQRNALSTTVNVTGNDLSIQKLYGCDEITVLCK